MCGNFAQVAQQQQAALAAPPPLPQKTEPIAFAQKRAGDPNSSVSAPAAMPTDPTAVLQSKQGLAAPVVPGVKKTLLGQ